MPDTARRGLARAPPDAKAGDVFTSCYTPSGSPPVPVPDSLPPVDGHPSLPCIFHILVPCGLHPPSAPPPLSTATLQSLLVQQTHLSSAFLDELCLFGAVFVRVGPLSPNISPRPPRLSDLAVLAAPLPPHTPIYARVHACPRRHRALWPLATLPALPTADLVPLAKPAGLPTVPAVDNLHECITAHAARLLRLPAPLRVTARLDVGTSGALVLARTPAAAAAFNAALRARRVAKTYAVLTTHPPRAQGTLAHSVARGALRGDLVRPRGTGTDGGEDEGGRCTAELVVEHVRRARLGAGPHTRARASCRCKAAELWESRVRLITGRTHQIRLQFAAEGSPVWGDTKYSSAGSGDGFVRGGDGIGGNPELLGLHSARLEFTWEGQRCVVDAGPPWWETEKVELLDCGGLHC